MKRILLVILIVLVAAAMVPAQTVDFTQFQAQFVTFADAVAGTLASTASSAGLSWSPAYIGQFPHLGVGISVGASLIPYSAVEPIITLVGASIPAELTALQTYGIPLPAAAIDARIGGFILPFDIGLKFGTIPPALQSMLGPISVDYVLAGADFRLALLKDQGLSPALSVGVGYTYFKGSIGLAGVIPGGTDVDITQIMNYAGYAGTYSLSFTDPDLTFDWQSNVVELKAQLSKQILFFTPHIGLSGAYGISKAGGGLNSTMTYNATGPATEAQMQQVFVDNGYPAPTSQGMAVSSPANGWSFRAYGGIDIALLILHVDVNASYNILTGSVGGGANIRIQLLCSSDSRAAPIRGPLRFPC
jgi:hypothetical protein